LSLARRTDLFLKKHDPPDGEASGESALETSLRSAAANVAASSCDIAVDRHRSVGAWTVSQASTIKRETAPVQTLGVFERANALGRTARRDSPVVS